MLVFAVAVVVGEHVVSCVRLITSNAKRDANIPVMRAHEGVNGV